MARKKEYIESEVIQKAMNLFWRNGYETTSMQMLEKEMGINKFSMYASFGSKNGIFIESLKCYKTKLNVLIEKLNSSNSGNLGIKQYFYDFIEFSKETEIAKGCLITNTVNELGKDSDERISNLLVEFTDKIKLSFANSLKQDVSKNKATIQQQSDYLLISMFGLSSASRVFNSVQMNNYIENIFKNI